MDATEGASIIDYRKLLPSGMTVAYDDIPAVGTTALAFFVHVGSRDETPEAWGVAHLLEHLVFKGAGDWDFREIAARMDMLGGDINAFTTREYTCFHAKVLDPYAEEAFLLLRDLVTRPWLRPEDIEREKRVVLEEMKESQDDPDEVTDQVYADALYADSSLTHDILGTPESLAQVGGEEVRAFFDHWYNPANMVFAVSGGGRDALVDRLASDPSKTSGTFSLPRKPPVLRLETRMRKAPWEQVHVMLGTKAPPRDGQDYYAALLLALSLGGQNSSRLWQRLREEAGLVYQVGTQYMAERDYGDMAIYLALGHEEVPQALTLMREEIESMAHDGPSREEILRSARLLETSLVFGLETPDGRVQRLGRYALWGESPPPVSSMIAQVRAVEPKRIRQLAEELWVMPEALAVAATGPITDVVASQLGGRHGMR